VVAPISLFDVIAAFWFARFSDDESTLPSNFGSKEFRQLPEENHLVRQQQLRQ
jgi:hypothetical protein